MEVKLVGYTQPSEEFKGDFSSVKDLIAYCARVSNPSNQFNTETTDKLISYLLKHKHFSPFEMASATIEITTTRDIARQILRHRSFTFQEFCIAGDSKITTLAKSGRSKKIQIRDLYERYSNKVNWDKSDNLVRVFDEASKTFVPVKIKEVFKTGVKPVYELILENGKKVISTKEHKFLSRRGFLPLEDLYDDDFIGCSVVSVYQPVWSKIKSIKFKGFEETYDMEVEHSSHNYIANGVVTHNSQRYADPRQLGFVIRETRLQDLKNRQNSIGLDPLDIDGYNLDQEWKRRQQEVLDIVKENYAWAIENNIAKEQARAILPEGNTVSRMYMQGTIRSFIHYIELRREEGTQREHQDVAIAVGKAISKIFPV
jgi:thymidylate synthase ThyX